MSSMVRGNAVEARRGDTIDTEERANFLGHNPGHKRGGNRFDGVERHGLCARSERFQWIRENGMECLLLVSSESDSAALAPLQQEFRPDPAALGHHSPALR
jgi:hypothetical protein